MALFIPVFVQNTALFIAFENTKAQSISSFGFWSIR